jgi:CheY-like chemotaxis protein
MEDNGGELKIALDDVAIAPSDRILHPHLEPGDYVRLKVSDNGTGIPDDILDSIFEPYFTTKPIGEGTGLGLSVVHGLINKLRGDISVKSAAGAGTTFTVLLPVFKKRVPGKTARREPLPTGSERILFVDDEPSIARMSKRQLEKLGYKVEACSSVTDALDIFRKNPGAFDLVITDMTMPRLTGDKLAGEMMKIRPDIPVILCTGYSRKIGDKSAAELGIKAFLMKPLTQDVLSKTVREVLDRTGE